MYNIYIGWDSRELAAYDVAEHTIRKHSPDATQLNIQPLKQDVLRACGVYRRPSDEAASVEFTYTRFLVPFIQNYEGWAYFCDCDFLFTKDVEYIFNLPHIQHDMGWDDPHTKAVFVVKHDYTPRAETKMDGEKQVAYPRKNWSSSILWNCSHPANKALTLDFLNNVRPSVLHRFGWLDDSEIGELPLHCNWLEGEYDKPEGGSRV